MAYKRVEKKGNIFGSFKENKLFYFLILFSLFLLIIVLLFSFDEGFKDQRITGYFTGSGSGTVGDPFLITNCTQLQEMQDNLTAYYQLVNNIDCSNTTNWNYNVTTDYHMGFEPVSIFAGSFNGSNYNITGLFINRSTNKVGLFGYISTSAVINNVGLIDANITGNQDVGGLVGYGQGSAIDKSYTIGNILGNSINVGGVVGYGDVINLNNSYSRSNVTGINEVGGLVGYGQSSVIDNSYATGSVDGTDRVGGLVGYSYDTTLDNSYSSGNVTGTINVGGLVGAFEGVSCTNNFWDNETSGQSTSACGTGKTTSQMKTQSTFTNWDFTNIWSMAGYPHFKWENTLFISDCSQLQLMNINLSANYTLMNNIDCSDTTSWNSGLGFEPVGNDTVSFTGSFDGAGYNITGLFINRSSNYVGLFGYTDGGAVISNVGLVDMNITGNRSVGALAGFTRAVVNNSSSGGIVGGNWYVGGLFGVNDGNISISSSTAGVSGVLAVGGLIGWNFAGIISNSSSSGSIVNGSDYSGGFVGANFIGAEIISSYSTSDVFSTNFTGGFVGWNFVGGFVNDSYSSGDVSGGSGFTGGFAGSNDGNISNSYSVGNVTNGSVVGGFVGGDSGGTYSADFWDYETAGNYNDSGTSPYDLVNVSANTTSVMTTQSTFTNWDFTNTWKIVTGSSSYPCLQWQENSTCIFPSVVEPSLRLPSPSGGGRRTLIEDFTVSADSMIVRLRQGEQKSEDFTITNIGEGRLTLFLDLIDLEDFVTLSDDPITLGLDESKIISVDFFAGQDATLGTYNGQIEISGSPLKVIDVVIEVVEEPIEEPGEEVEETLDEEKTLEKEKKELSAFERTVKNFKNSFKKISKPYRILILLILLLLILLLIIFYIKKYIKSKKH